MLEQVLYATSQIKGGLQCRNWEHTASPMILDKKVFCSYAYKVLLPLKTVLCKHAYMYFKTKEAQ